MDWVQQLGYGGFVWGQLGFLWFSVFLPAVLVFYWFIFLLLFCCSASVFGCEGSG